MGDIAKFAFRLGAIAAIAFIPACAKMEPVQRIDDTLPPPVHGSVMPKDTGEKPTSKAAETAKSSGAKVKDLHYVFRGSGRFLNKAPRRVQAFPEKGGITLNFVNAEVVEVVRAVLGGILHLNYAIDPGVKGSVTLQTSRPIPRGAVLGALENALDVAGAALVPSAGIYRIVPRAKAATQGAPTTIAGESPDARAGFTVRIVPLKFVSATEMKKILSPLASKGTIVRVDSARNLLVLAAPAPEIRALEDMVNVFDVDWLAGLSLAMVPLDFVDPEVLVKEINDVLGKDKDNPMTGVLRFVPMTRLNAVLVISPQPAYITRAEEIISKLDRGGNSTERQLFVYRLQNTDASDVANTLGELLAGKNRPTDLRGALAPQLSPARVNVKPYSQTAAASTNSTPSSSSSSSSQASGTQGQSSAQSQMGGTAGTVRRPARRAAQAFSFEGADQIRVVADRTNNAILVWATPADYRMVVSVLRKLDQVPLQVLIEATIAEVTLNDNLRYGVQWFFRNGDSSVTLSTGTTSAIASTFPGFSYFLNGRNVKAVLDALESVTNLNIISSPQLMVLDNQTAVLQVGDQVPILTQQSQSTLENAQVINSFTYRDTGIILRVTPRVNAGGLVTMTVEQEASLVADKLTTEGIQSPTFRQRKITSTVAVQSGETVVLGGLIQDTRDHSESGIPFLRDIPGLGFFFGGKSNDKGRTELLVLITPRAVRSQREVRRVTEELRKRLRAVIPLTRKIR